MQRWVSIAVSYHNSLHQIYPSRTIIEKKNPRLQLIVYAMAIALYGVLEKILSDRAKKF